MINFAGVFAFPNLTNLFGNCIMETADWLRNFAVKPIGNETSDNNTRNFIYGGNRGAARPSYAAAEASSVNCKTCSQK